MKNLLKLYFLSLSLLCLNTSIYAQLDDGEFAEDWDVTDLNGVDWSLEDFMDDGKHVILDFSATWCGPCWNYHNTHILDDLHDDFGPNGSDELFVFMFEADGSTNDACCYGPAGCNDSSWGNWTNTSYPVVNLTGSELSIVGDYQIAYFPTIYIINGDHQTVWEVGQASYNSWTDIIEESFTLEVEVDVYPGSCDMGELVANGSGGDGNLSYQWSTGHWGQSVNVSSGTYEVTVTDQNGYFVVVSTEIENDLEEFYFNDEELINVSCHDGDDGSIYVDIESSGDVEYEWSNGDDSNFINDLEAGSYSLTVTNSDNGCSEVYDYEITEPEAISAEAEVFGTLCGESNGQITVMASGGAGNFVYDFGNGFSTENSAENIAGGEIEVVVEDDAGCQFELELFVPESEALQATLVGQDIINCFVPNVTFTTETNSSNPISYQWLDSDGNLLSTENNISLDQSGLYTVQLVDDLLACTFEQSFEIFEDFQLPNVNLSETQELNCNLSSFEMSFSGDGDENMTGLWSYINTDGDLVTFEGNEFLVEEGGNYELAVTNNINGCMSVYDFEVSEYYNIPLAYYQAEINMETVTLDPQAEGDNIVTSWLLDGLEIDVENNTILFEENGFYDLCLQVENECGLDQYCEVIEISGIISSTNDFMIDGVSVFMSQSNLIINNSAVQLEDAIISVVSSSGQLVHRSNQLIGIGTNSINVNNWMPGVYLVSIEVPEGIFTSKVYKL